MRKKFRFFFFATVLVTCALYLAIVSLFSGASPAKGWEGNRSRNLRSYVSETLLPHLLPREFCGAHAQKKMLLIMVSSRPGGFEARRAIRETWGQKNDNVSVWFLLGEHGDNQELQQRIEIESVLFDDVIQERFLDSYTNLTIKSVEMLKLFSFYCGENYHFLMKVDDDVFVNIPHLVNKLENKIHQKELLLGKRREKASPFRFRGSKWYMPYAWYPEDTYPDFLCGAIYVMSAHVVQKLYKCTLEEPLLHIEDVFITGICARKMKINVENDDCFMCAQLTRSLCHYKNNYNFHYFKPEDILAAYRELLGDCPIYKDINVPLMWYSFFEFL